MGDSAFIGGVFAGLAYFVAAIRLIRLSWRSLNSPEFILGMALLVWGLSYTCWQIPIAFASEPLMLPLFFLGRVLTVFGAILFASFMRIVFRPNSRWARYFVWAIALSSIAGVAGSIAVGDWEGIKPRSNHWWWLDWGAAAAATSWAGVEGFIRYAKLRPRIKQGFCDPIECHRFLLWGWTGVVWAVYSLVLLYQTMEYESNSVWSITMDRLNGGVEATGCLLILLIFFTPRFYVRWIGGAEPTANPEGA